MRESKCTKEFKDSTVQLALNGDKPAVQIAKELDINSKTLYNWIREYKKKNNIKIDKRRTIQRSNTKETIDEENRRLRTENKRLSQEVQILKKAAAYFAKEA